MSKDLPRACPAVTARPLYQQVHDYLLGRIVTGEWQPGDYLPSEQRLAASLGVALGTVRRALDELAEAGVVERRQGRGTAVLRHSSDRARFRFFRLVGPDGARIVPTGRVLAARRRAARAGEARALGLSPSALVLGLTRERRVGGRALVHETIALPLPLFARLDLPVGQDLAEELYVLYQHDCGVTVARAEDRISPEAAPVAVARSLGIAPGTPILRIRRIAFGLDGVAVEHRISRSARLDYAVAIE
ncbi:GntR family transcriptional regulator [Elioraea tepida]|uniref:GntR family transcriptional regulator n=1 Tax=Elioraea tepida TaxID=2843330 RepID=A0A975U240_9PROT|nr:GntR family transcriptional regulator [Elioraea tepida]QXM24932.1 GntR family transcriptional regulator [Elioraea tepida]